MLREEKLQECREMVPYNYELNYTYTLSTSVTFIQVGSQKVVSYPQMEMVILPPNHVPSLLVQYLFSEDAEMHLCSRRHV